MPANFDIEIGFLDCHNQFCEAIFLVSVQPDGFMLNKKKKFDLILFDIGKKLICRYL